jgi:hypothetical protein
MNPTFFDFESAADSDGYGYDGECDQYVSAQFHCQAKNKIWLDLRDNAHEECGK